MTLSSTEDAGRNRARAKAVSAVESGDFLARLADAVAYPTESQMPERRDDLRRYLREFIGPQLADLGFALTFFDGADAGNLPTLLATRIEDPALPTVMIYGHGDVVRGLPDQWREGLDPWKVSFDGDRIYGRGTADNKGQHLLALEALRAVLEVRGRLGFNAKFFLETGEEIGSPGLRPVLRDNRDACAADVFIAFDGPRLAEGAPEINLGARGAVNIDLVVKLREGTHHSGHWGGILADPGILLSHAIASIVSREGHILVPEWLPKAMPADVKAACAKLRMVDPAHPRAEPWWGEPGLSRAERIFGWTSVITLSMLTGRPEAPISAVQGEATARISVRHTVDVDASTFVPALRDHFRREGHHHVEVRAVQGDDIFPPFRTDPGNIWVRRICASMGQTSGQDIQVIPNNSAGNPSALFFMELGTPAIWIPHSYPGCEQHGPNEHALKSLLKEGLDLTAGLWWDFGNPEFMQRREL